MRQWEVNQLLFEDGIAMVAASTEKFEHVEFGKVCERRKLKINTSIMKSNVLG